MKNGIANNENELIPVNIRCDAVNTAFSHGNADNIANYATLGFAALREKNHEKCGFYADDILKRKADAPESRAGSLRAGSSR